MLSEVQCQGFFSGCDQHSHFDDCQIVRFTMSQCQPEVLNMSLICYPLSVAAMGAGLVVSLQFHSFPVCVIVSCHIKSINDAFVWISSLYGFQESRERGSEGEQHVLFVDSRHKARQAAQREYGRFWVHSNWAEGQQTRGNADVLIGIVWMWSTSHFPLFCSWEWNTQWCSKGPVSWQSKQPCTTAMNIAEHSPR